MNDFMYIIVKILIFYIVESLQMNFISDKLADFFNII